MAINIPRSHPVSALEPKYRTVVKFMAEDTDADFGFTDADGNTALHYLMRNERILEMKSFIQAGFRSDFASLKITYWTDLY